MWTPTKESGDLTNAIAPYQLVPTVMPGEFVGYAVCYKILEYLMLEEKKKEDRNNRVLEEIADLKRIVLEQASQWKRANMPSMNGCVRFLIGKTMTLIHAKRYERLLNNHWYAKEHPESAWARFLYRRSRREYLWRRDYFRQQCFDGAFDDYFEIHLCEVPGEHEFVEDILLLRDEHRTRLGELSSESDSDDKEEDHQKDGMDVQDQQENATEQDQQDEQDPQEDATEQDQE